LLIVSCFPNSGGNRILNYVISLNCKVRIILVTRIVKREIIVNREIFGKNLRVVRKFLRLTQTQFAEPLGITGVYVSDIERGGSTPSEPVMRQMELKYRVNRNFLETGKGEMFSQQPVGRQDNRQDETPLGGEYIRVPLYNAVAQGGPGSINGYEEVESYLSFSQEYAKIQFGNSGLGLASLRASGDSMSPYIVPGDVMIVDVSDRSLTKDGAAYILQIDETTVVKRMQRLSRETIRIASDNPTGWSRDIHLSDLSGEGIAIAGRVVAVIKMA